MNIRWKVGALVATLLVVLGVSEIFVANSVLIPSFADLERSDAEAAMRRIDSALGRSFNQLAQSATSWGNWADTYHFAHDHNRAFIDENLTAIGLKQLDVNALVILDTNGRAIASGTLDSEAAQPLDVDSLRRTVSAADFPWRQDLRAGRAAHGLLRTDRGILMLAAEPILDGFGHGPARGMVMMGRELSQDEIGRLAAQSQVKLALLSPGAHSGSGVVSTENSTAVYRSFSDLYGRPAMTLRVEVPREITRRGRSAVYYATACLMATAVIVVILLILILNKVVLAPLARVTRHAVTIGENADLTNRLAFDRTDEIGVLAGELDRMVARVAASRSQLVDQSFQAGLAELAKGVLHNLGNAMTPIGVRLALLHKRLRSFDHEDFELMAHALSGAPLDAAQQLDLAELLHLSNNALVELLRAAQDDVEVIMRQTSIVQSALSEQMRVTHNEHVWEPVRLADLVAQSLEVVPDGARQRLEVQTDGSVDEMGVVYVPRTLLRLVLQNLIINAADAVSETGRARGLLRIEAQVTRARDDEQLVLHCTDDGVGIEAESLARIFEKGFSTKSKETNFGIGLHWCANALGALEGRVWATSDGVGHGTSMHVCLPLKRAAGRALTKAA